MAAFDDLTRLVPPPPQPLWANGDWNEVEAALGMELPSDFKQLVGAYGAYHFAEFLTPLTSFGGRDLLVGPAKRLLDNGDRVCWLTDRKPDEWTVVCWNPRGWYYDAHSVGAVEFLLGWLSGHISTNIFPDAFEFAEVD
ncbi:hypothetical protein [Streptomyces mirabilis]|uniref:hypothetical protein n=1 Tax=Streptomyces mirabilis TaxID=68239 RepID=UPI003442765D